MEMFNLQFVRSLLVVLIGVALFLSGCASGSKSSTTVSTTEVYKDPENTERSRYDGSPTVEVTKTEEVTKEDNRRGFFGILGDIIALPFRAIASIL